MRGKTLASKPVPALMAVPEKTMDRMRAAAEPQEHIRIDKRVVEDL